MQSVFPIAVQADDAFISRSDANATVWPPPGGTGVDIVDPTSTWIQPERTKLDYGQGLRYWLGNGFLRFNTSSIPDGASISAAFLQINVAFAQASNDLLIEWYTWTPPIAVANWTSTNSSNAGSFSSGGGGGGIGVVTIPLTTPSNINLSGYTGFRLHAQIASEPPTGENTFYLSSFDHTTHQEPRLVVNYELVNTIMIPNRTGPR
jgi:hypothetical protein